MTKTGGQLPFRFCRECVHTLSREWVSGVVERRKRVSELWAPQRNENEKKKLWVKRLADFVGKAGGNDESGWAIV